MKILVAEDHPKIREGIIQILKREQYDAVWAIHGREALEILEKDLIDMVLLDINMPILNGRDFMREIRDRYPHLRIIALTSNNMIDDKVEMFELGCDDYITKPFDTKELIIRIQNIFKRYHNTNIQHNIRLWDITINIIHHQVWKGDRLIELPRKEYLILEYLAHNHGIIKNKTQILEKVWWEQEENLNYDSITLEAHISSLRRKLGKDIIVTHKGFGYCIPLLWKSTPPHISN